VSPTIPILPTDIDQREIYIRSHKEHVRSALTRLTGPTNLDSGLPVGLQLTGKPFGEANLYRFGHAFEQANPVQSMSLK